MTETLPYCFPQHAFLDTISSTFNVCVPTFQALASIVLGNLSILAWLCAQLPQVIKNWRLQSTAGLSLWFLLEWCLGDATNLIGAYMTGQASWQVVLGAYYTVIDIILVCQFAYYSHFRPWRDHHRTHHTARCQEQDRQSLLDAEAASQRRPESQVSRHKQEPSLHISRSRPRDITFEPVQFTAAAGPPSHEQKKHRGRDLRHNQATNDFSNIPGPSPKTVLLLTLLCAVLTRASPTPSALPLPPPDSTADDTFNVEVLGRTVSWISTFLYLGSRLPQIYKNHVRRSTSGLSPALFIAAFFGNLFYSTSLLVNPCAWASYGSHGYYGWVGTDGSDRVTWTSAAVPFFLGAAGVLALDAAVGVQFLIFGEGRDGTKVIEVEDDRGRSHWRRVSGWMRGWIPSPSPSPGMSEDGTMARRTRSRLHISESRSPNRSPSRILSVPGYAELSRSKSGDAAAMSEASDSSIMIDDDRPLLKRDSAGSSPVRHYGGV